MNILRRIKHWLTWKHAAKYYRRQFRIAMAQANYLDELLANPTIDTSDTPGTLSFTYFIYSGYKGEWEP